MLELAVGTVVVLLVLAGVLIMVGPALPRVLRRRPGRPPVGPRRSARTAARPVATITAEPEPELHPTTRRALDAAARLSRVLKAGGRDREAAAVRAAARRLRVDEPGGIYALQEVIRALRRLVLPDTDLHAQFVDQLEAVRREVSDRAEQLELLPRR